MRQSNILSILLAAVTGPLAILSFEADDEVKLLPAAYKRGLPQWTEQQLENRQHLQRQIKEEEQEITSNHAEWKRRHLEVTGNELTDEDIDEAIRSAKERGPQRFGEGYQVYLTKNITGLEEFYRPTIEEEVEIMGRRRTAVAAKSKGVLVSGLSPGWEWNSGRNEFYCVGINDLGKDKLPKSRARLEMKDCYKTRYELISLEYTVHREIVFNDLDQTSWNWCAGAKNARKSGINVDICDFEDEFQVWDLLTNDNTWRPDVEGNNCVEAKPSKSAAGGGGRLKIRQCTNKDKNRQAQVFLWCKQISKCVFDKDTGFMKDTCYLEDDCT